MGAWESGDPGSSGRNDRRTMRRSANQSAAPSTNMGNKSFPIQSGLPDRTSAKARIGNAIQAGVVLLPRLPLPLHTAYIDLALLCTTTTPFASTCTPGRGRQTRRLDIENGRETAWEVATVRGRGHLNPRQDDTVGRVPRAGTGHRAQKAGPLEVSSYGLCPGHSLCSLHCDTKHPPAMLYVITWTMYSTCVGCTLAGLLSSARSNLKAFQGPN
ncbi:hypothetical protein BD413DRAFT_225030 [Trametes elegans]|nr:hypothetical protein BD413DRAFT_225030 [Trametes elegans]